MTSGHIKSVDTVHIDPYKNRHVLVQGDSVSQRIIIFDTTLRDGEQSPGCSMNLEEKLRMARQLDALGVDVVEAGFPVASEDDFRAVHAVAREVRRPVIAALARTTRDDIERAWRAIEAAARPRLHTFVATSDLHIQHKLRKTRDEVLDMAVEAVRLARSLTDDVEFSAEDATRSDVDFLCGVVAAAVEAGATTINIPDTVGYTVPSEFARIIRVLQEKVPGIRNAILSVHCHNDLGLAVANSVAAVQAGARQVECTVNGIGERAGNTSMEEVVMAIKTRRDRFGVDTGIVTEQIYPTSRLLAQITGIPIPINKPIVGDNAFAHEAGIHQDGVLKNRLNYEIMQPESVGLDSNRLVLGKHSGRHAFVDRLRELGLDLTHVDMNRIFDRFKGLADAKQDVFDEDLIALVAEESVRGQGGHDRYELVYLNVTSSSMAIPHATVKLRIDGEEVLGHGTGDGMVDACYKVIADLTGQHPKLERYAVKAITGGTDAQGEVSVLVREDAHTVTGQGSHTDIIQASALAYVNALNKLEYRRQYRQRQQAEVGP